MTGTQKLRLIAEKSKPLRPLYIQLLFVALAFALLVGSSYFFASGIVRKHLRAEMESTLSHVESQLFFEMREIETMLGVVSENLREMLLHGSSLEEAEAYMRDITVYGHEEAQIIGLMNFAAYFDIFGGMVYNPVYDIPGFEFRGGEDFIASSRPWYKAAVEANGKTAATDAYVDAATGNVTLTYARAIFDEDNNRIAIVSVDVSLDTIHEVSFSVHGADGNYWALLDNNLIVIAHPDADFIGRHVSGLEGGISDIVNEIERGEEIVERSMINYKGEESVITIRQIKNGWFLAVNTPIENYYADMRVMQRGLVGLGFALAVILCVILTSTTVKKNKAEKQIHEADRYRQTLLESMETMIVITGLDDDKIIYMNERMKETFGFDDSIVGDKCWKHINKGMDKRCGICPKNDSGFPGKPYAWEFRNPILNRDFRIISSVIDWPDGSKVFLEQVDDITELKTAIAEKDSLVNLGNTLNGLDATIFVTDPDTDEILFINDALIRILGLEGEVVGQKCYAALRRNSKRCDFCPLPKLDEDPERKVVWDEANPDTNRIHRHTSGYITWLNGKKVYLQYTVDITELREMTNALDKRLEQQSLMTDISRSFLSDESIDVLMAQALRMAGEFMGIAQILMFVAEENKSTLACRYEWINPGFDLPSRIGYTMPLSQDMLSYFEKMKKQGKTYITSNEPGVMEAAAPYRVYFFNFLLMGIYFGDSLYAVLDFSKDCGDEWINDEINVSSVISNIITGVLQKRIAEEQLISAKEFAEQSSRYKSAFLANMSHEIRTPMNAILGIAEIELQNETHSAGTQDSLEKMYDSGNLLLNIINDILDLSKIEAGKLEIMPVRYDIPSLINDAAQLNLIRYESKPIIFNIEIDKNTPVNLTGDELRIKQVLNNMLSNAFKYTEKGEVSLSVFPEEKAGGGEAGDEVVIVFRIGDTGQGMTQEQLGTLFDEYTRFNMEANRTTIGTGLGMSITKRLLDLMGGEIFVESEVGKGSVFTVRIPQKRAGAAVCGPELADRLRGFRFRSTPMSKKSRIMREYMPYGSVLVVDDVESNIYVTKGMLMPYGLRIETASSGFIAVDKIKGGSLYDIIFMDHMMPKMDGIEAAKIIRDMGYKGFIIALTANALVGQSEMFLQNGFDAFISKPIDSRELNVILNEFIRDKKPREAVKAARDEYHEKGAGAASATVAAVSGLEECFLLDAENAVGVLESICKSPGETGGADMDLYEITVHGMKSALNNIGETGLSDSAYKLELAAKEKDTAVVTGETPAFIDALKALIERHRPANENTGGEKTGTGALGDDAAYLRERLLDIKASCDRRDITAAKAAVKDLMQKEWPDRVNYVLDEINVHLLHGAFKKAADAVAAAAEYKG